MNEIDQIEFEDFVDSGPQFDVNEKKNSHQSGVLMKFQTEAKVSTTINLQTNKLRE